MLRGIFGSGGGAAIGGGGTSSPSTIPRWTGPSTLGDSGLIDDGTQVYTTTRRFGVGTATPSSPGTIQGAFSAAVPQLIVRDSAGASGAVWVTSNHSTLTGTIRVGPVSGGYGFAVYDSFSHTFRESGNHAMTILNGGNVGIGTASPVTTLHVARNGTTDPAIIGSGTNSAVGNFESSDFGRANRWTFGRDNSLTGNFVLAYNGSPLMNTTSSGNVGIGTASPASVISANSTVLAVAAPGGNLGTVRVSNTSNFSGNHAELFASTTSVGIWGSSNCPMLFYTNNNERARIDSSGRLLLGLSTAPSSAEIRQLITPGSGANGGQQWASSNGGFALTPLATNGGATFYAYSGNVGSESYAASFRATSTGLDVSVAAATPGLKLPATPGNPDTQTLDCYAEVAWTPADVSGAGLTITVNRATYTKIGRTVTASFDISYPVTANGTAAQISLPESTGTANLGTLSAPFCSSSTSTAGLTGIVTNGRIVFYYGIPSANVPNSVFSGARIVASVTFTV